MGQRRKNQPGPQQNGEGMHGSRTHSRFIEQLHEGEPEQKATERDDVEGHHRLHQDREQHDIAEKNSEKVEAMREIRRGRIDENVLAHARIPHEGDST